MSDRTVWDLTRRIYRQFHDQPTPMQLGRLAEEVGEVWEAYSGMTGANPRKGGTTHCPADVTQELWDVIITAMVALHHFADDPQAAAGDYLEKYEARLAAADTPRNQGERPDLCPPGSDREEPTP